MDTNKNAPSQNKGQNLENMLPIRQVEQKVQSYIIGQNQQIRQIITAIYRSQAFKSLKSNILIIGKSGTGKTETIKQIARVLDIPYTIEDATKYTQEGYVGASVEEMIAHLIENANGYLSKAQKGILVIDEIDKKARNRDDISISNDISGEEVLRSLLKIIEGTDIVVPVMTDRGQMRVKFNTRGLIVILSGAFEGLDEIRNKRLNRKKIGFGASSDEKAKDNSSKILKQDLVSYGMPEEFVGRIDTIVEMKTLTERDLSLILRKSKLSVFKNYEREIAKMGVRLTYDADIFDAIAKASLHVDTGARELSNTVNYMFERILYEIFSKPDKYHLCNLSTDIVKNNNKFRLV